MPTLLENLKKKGVKIQRNRKQGEEPLWKGPEVDGITQSMINSFLECPERFRVRNVLGLGPPDEFRHAIEYGQMWHICEEHEGGDWKKALLEYVKGLAKQYPLQQEQISKWYQVCLRQFEVYEGYWKKRRGTWSLAEEVTFEVPYKLPSGRVVKMRGKWDGLIVRETSQRKDLWLKENKTKGTIDEEQIRKQHDFDLQTMFYITALKKANLRKMFAKDWDASSGEKRKISPKIPPIRGVMYNVIRRPLSGGKGTIRSHKPTKKNPQGESDDQFYDRLQEVIRESAETFFVRWNVIVTTSDIKQYCQTFLEPILERLCNWYNWVAGEAVNPQPFAIGGAEGLHYRTPYGIWSSIARGMPTDVDEYLKNGSTRGLVQVDRLFKELD